MTQEQLAALIERGEEQGCINLSAFTELTQELELDDEQLEALYAALDERGVQWSSHALAERIASWRDQGAPELAFAIGGAEGVHSMVLDRADVTLSLGSMTWPHLLVRGMLLEQLYRAQQILAGHPYHRG